MDHILAKDAFFFVVAEDKGVQTMIKAALNIEGFHRVLTFARARDILQAATAILPEVYIIDYALPGITGLALYEQLQPADKYIPCILLNAPRLPAKWANGPLWTLQLPFALDELFECVREALRSLASLSVAPEKNQIPSGPDL